MSAHTKGQARYSDGHEEFGVVWADKMPIAGVCINRLPAEVQRANARRIMQCWNSHDDLVAQLEFAVTILSGIPAVGGTAQVDAMRAAIAKAREEV